MSGLGFGVWGSGFGGWGLGRAVQGLGVLCSGSSVSHLTIWGAGSHSSGLHNVWSGVLKRHCTQATALALHHVIACATPHTANLKPPGLQNFGIGVVKPHTTSNSGDVDVIARVSAARQWILAATGTGVFPSVKVRSWWMEGIWCWVRGAGSRVQGVECGVLRTAGAPGWNLARREGAINAICTRLVITTISFSCAWY